MSTLKAKELIAVAESGRTAEESLALQAEALKARIEAELKAALDVAQAKEKPETTDPEPWWNLFTIGPIQPITGSPGPVFSHQVIKAGEPAFVATVLVLNPANILAGPTSPGEVLSNFALPFEVQYQTCDQTNCSVGPASLNVVHAGGLIPHTYIYVDVLGFIGSTTGATPNLFEMNVTARILGAAPPFISAPQFAGFARAVVDIDPDVFFGFIPDFPAPGFQFDFPTRFMVYP